MPRGLSSGRHWHGLDLALFTHSLLSCKKHYARVIYGAGRRGISACQQLGTKRQLPTPTGLLQCFSTPPLPYYHSPSVDHAMPVRRPTSLYHPLTEECKRLYPFNPVNPPPPALVTQIHCREGLSLHTIPNYASQMLFYPTGVKQLRKNFQ